VDPSRIEQQFQSITDAQGAAPKKTTKLAEVLESKDVDAVIVATPDHWHALATILACQAGKDVYVEKPHSHNIWESRKMIEAARRYGRVVQVGTQNRSAPYNFKAREYIRSGGPGDIRLVKVFNLKPGREYKLGAPGTQPPGFDWDAWLGPAPSVPYHPQIFDKGWHQYWDYNGGDMIGDGIHQIDLAMMVLGNPGIPKAVYCTGGRYQYRGDDSQVPDLQLASLEFDDFLLSIEHANYPAYMLKTTADIRRNAKLPFWTQNATRIELYGSKEMMIVGRHGGGWISMGKNAQVTQTVYGEYPDSIHQKNFLDCVKTRERPTADIEVLHPSIVLAHMANIAHRVGNRKLHFDPKTERFVDSVEANNLLKREYREKYRVPEVV
jgi:predicted dehydrogenase